MPSLSVQALTDYLTSLYRKPVHITAVTGHGAQEEGDDLKGFGYGSPLFVEYDEEGEPKKAVLKAM